MIGEMGSFRKVLSLILNALGGGGEESLKHSRLNKGQLFRFWGPFGWQESFLHKKVEKRRWKKEKSIGGCQSYVQGRFILCAA